MLDAERARALRDYIGRLIIFELKKMLHSTNQVLELFLFKAKYLQNTKRYGLNNVLFISFTAILLPSYAKRSYLCIENGHAWSSVHIDRAVQTQDTRLGESNALQSGLEVDNATSEQGQGKTASVLSQITNGGCLRVNEVPETLLNRLK